MGGSRGSQRLLPGWLGLEEEVRGSTWAPLAMLPGPGVEHQAGGCARLARAARRQEGGRLAAPGDSGSQSPPPPRCASFYPQPPQRRLKVPPLIPAVESLKSDVRSMEVQIAEKEAALAAEQKASASACCGRVCCVCACQRLGVCVWEQARGRGERGLCSALLVLCREQAARMAQRGAPAKR